MSQTRFRSQDSTVSFVGDVGSCGNMWVIFFLASPFINLWNDTAGIERRFTWKRTAKEKELPILAPKRSRAGRKKGGEEGGGEREEREGEVEGEGERAKRQKKKKMRRKPSARRGKGQVREHCKALKWTREGNTQCALLSLLVSIFFVATISKGRALEQWVGWGRTFRFLKRNKSNPSTFSCTSKKPTGRRCRGR